jgi:hypothetical protein
MASKDEQKYAKAKANQQENHEIEVDEFSDEFER